MTDLGDRLGALPSEWMEFLETQRGKLPPSLRKQVDALFDAVPVVPRPLRGLFDRVYAHSRAAFDDTPVTVTVVGPVNSGKSTLVNSLTGREVAATSPVAGTTLRPQWVGFGPFRLLDTPGLNEPNGAERAEMALNAAADAELILLLLDAAKGVDAQDQAIYRRVAEMRKPLLVALNKVDLIRGYEAAALDAAESALGLRPLAISCRTGYHVGDLMKALVLLDARVINIMSGLLPEHRREVARQRVSAAAALAAAVGWEPLPVADLVPLTAIQAVMVLEVGKLYGQRVSLSRARELLATFAGGVALREGYRQVAKLIPVAGNLLSAAYASAGTAALGAAAIAWFEADGRMAEGDARRLYRDAFDHVRSSLRTRLTRRGRNDRGIEPAVEEALERIDPPADSAPPRPV